MLPDPIGEHAVNHHKPPLLRIHPVVPPEMNKELQKKRLQDVFPPETAMAGWFWSV